ncbi:MAG: tetratricopeptide repeat protein [Bacteroidota bacterium]
MAAPAPAPSTPLLSRGKRLAFTAAMLLLPLAFFVLVEGGLRLANYGESRPLFLPASAADDASADATDSAYLVQNREVARRYFANQANVPNSPADVFLAQKPEDGLRVFVQGGSSAAGYPFYYGGAFPRMLEQRLQQTFPDRTVEVVNTAMSAVNSYTLLDLTDEILAHDPDAVVVYAGHNEYYGALGAASAETLGRTPWVVRSYLALQNFRLVQAMRGGLTAIAKARAGEPTGEPPSNTLMARMVGEQRVPLGSDVYEAGLRQFRSNLSRLLATYERAGVPVFIGTVASNERDHRPFLNAFEADTDEDAWEALVTAGVQALRRGDTAAALQRLAGATAMDTLAADGFYFLGQALLADGQAEAARTAFFAARERDALRFRAPDAINAIITELAAAHGATLVDSEARVRAASPDGLIGSAAMMEHLHPTLDGYFLIADAFYTALQDAMLFGDWSQALPTALARTERLYTPVDSLAGVFRVAQLMSGWPFRPGEAPRVAVLDTLHARSVPEQIAVDLYQNKTSWRGATDALATHYAEQGLITEALRTRFAIIQELPHLPGPLVDAGNVLVEAAKATGDEVRYQQAETFYEAALERAPTNAGILGLLGALKLQRGARADAIALLEEARGLAPANTQVLYNLSGAYALEGRMDDARATVQALLAIEPNHGGGRALLASLPSEA